MPAGGEGQSTEMGQSLFSALKGPGSALRMKHHLGYSRRFSGTQGPWHEGHDAGSAEGGIQGMAEVIVKTLSRYQQPLSPGNREGSAEPGPCGWWQKPQTG